MRYFRDIKVPTGYDDSQTPSTRVVQRVRAVWNTRATPGKCSESGGTISLPDYVGNNFATVLHQKMKTLYQV